MPAYISIRVMPFVDTYHILVLHVLGVVGFDINNPWLKRMIVITLVFAIPIFWEICCTRMTSVWKRCVRDKYTGAEMEVI